MMVWALAILFGTAALLLILSVFKNRQASKAEQQKIDMIYISIMEEINQLQEQIRNIELDGEIIAKEAGIQANSAKERLLLRELLDLYKRGYTIEGISAKKRLNENEIEHLLAPYMASKNERRKVANGS
jgi:hypothetical protein